MTQVLIVDDSPSMRRYVARTLELTGLEVTVHEAESGLEAIHKAYAFRPDVIVTDMSMPGMNGRELIDHVHTARDLQGIKLLVLSADHCSEHVNEAMRAGASAYLTKPVSPEVLRDALLSIIESHS